MFDWMVVFNDPANWAALITLIAMEVVLGIDNLLFISILTNKLPPEFREKARLVGISAALIMRLLLLSTVFIIVQLTEPVISLFGKSLSWRDIILIAGGLFLLWKATKEIHHHVEHVQEEAEDKALGVSTAATITFGGAIFQILLLDLVFSVDSIITAVGMTDHISLMVIAVLVSIGVMIVAANPLANFINANPTIVVLALAFLMMIGMML
ncbi:MAG: TerC family protein, partial [Beijerinckiaceae bacterium]